MVLRLQKLPLILQDAKNDFKSRLNNFGIIKKLQDFSTMGNLKIMVLKHHDLPLRLQDAKIDKKSRLNNFAFVK